MIEEPPLLDCRNRRVLQEGTTEKGISLTELVLDGKMPNDPSIYQGTCDDIPLPFRNLERLGVEIVKKEEQRGNIVKTKLYYLYQGERYPI